MHNQFHSRSQTGYRQDHTLLKVIIGKKFLTDNRAEISLQGFDLLNQDWNVTQTVTDTHIEDQQTKNLNWYFLLAISYRPNNF